MNLGRWTTRKDFEVMERLDGILRFMQQNAQQQPDRVNHDPVKIAAIMQQLCPAWQYGQTELAAIDALFNGTKWVLLTGNMGTGKTTLLRLFVQAYGIIERQPVKLYSTARFNLEYGAKGEQVILDHEHGLMCIDDLGVENKTQNRYGTVTDPISTLLFLRYESKARTMCSTNLDASALKARYGDRLADRFREMFQVIAFTGESRR